VRRDRPSSTALGVAFLRDAGSAPGAPYGIDDPVARSLLPSPLRALCGLVRAPFGVPLARLLSGGFLDHVALRTAAIDAELALRLGAGARQLVILGAGFDTRAYRTRALAGTAVFEVDIAATQAEKRARLGGRGAGVRFVEVDFREHDLGARLGAAGHDAGAPTAWIWEGVVPYLALAAIEETLGVLAARSAPRSALLLTYLTPEHVRGLPAPLLWPGRKAFAALGEPLLSELEPAEMRALLGRAGFDVDSDTGSAEWARGRLRRGPLVELTERLAVATRR